MRAWQAKGEPGTKDEERHMDNEARILLDDVIEFCRRDGREARLINMLEQCGAGDFDDETLTVQVPSRFAYSYLERQRTVVERYLEEVSFMPMRLNIQMMGRERSPLASSEDGREANDGVIPMENTRRDEPHRDDLSHVPSNPLRETIPVAPADATTGDPAVGAHPSGEPRGSINVVNTLSLKEYRRMVQEMEDDSRSSGNSPQRSQDADGQREAGHQRPLGRSSSGVRGAGQVANVEGNAGPAVDINAKYTFESFVAGDENRHAFNSAMRFAAYAEEPGQCPSLFIYGNSGLGKTHLLFAVRNYLAKEKPYINVKYANSQAYLDDYMNELGTQRGPGSPIMREYRDADILIIDDVQNIVGKQASVEFFFQLVDGFIREGKKVAFASDRAPKDLAMDERLTSRFSRGMLCLVSEPGFEMKYIILKRYYESIIRAPEALDAMNVDTSLLSMLPEHEGHLTDEHLRHMAEISGNNIRNLESFCERCAGLAAEREAEGAELSAQDIDETAKTYFNTARKVIHIDTVQRVVEEFYHVSHEEIIGPRRTASIAFARHVAVYLANSLCEMTTPAIGAEFGGRDHSTVLNSLKVVENKMREDRRICEDIQNLKNTILLKS